MAKKADLEAAYRACTDIGRRAAGLLGDREHAAALAVAVTARPHLSAAVAFQRRYRKPQPVSLPPAEWVVRLAPPLFARRPLADLRDWLAGLKKAERAALGDLPDRVAEAGGRLGRAVQLWADLDRQPFAGPDAAGLLADWQAAGLVTPAPGRGFRRMTDLARPAVGKCPRCGSLCERLLADLLNPAGCPGCGRVEAFVVVRRAG